MDRYLVTGVSGFVGQHFLRYLDTIDARVEVLGVDRARSGNVSTNYSYGYSYAFRAVDFFDNRLVSEIVSDFQPNYVLHLAATSSVGESLNNPEAVMLNNITSFLNVVDAIDASVHKNCRTLLVSSSEVYADSNEALEESSVCNVQRSPYAFSKSVCELIAKRYCEEHNLDIVTTRSFMHTGPNQNERFVVSSFISRIISAKRSGVSSMELQTGNIDILRDITDVRDVVRAYYLLLKGGCRNELYNVCSGEVIKLRSIIEQISILLGITVLPVIDSQRLRPNDPQIVLGSNKKILKSINWLPQIPLSQTLKDMIYCCES
jgi:GDP-4-dehydro-6-deoxy-D-mannose reductase